MPSEDMKSLGDQALDALEQGRLAEARQLYEQITSAEPDNGEAWMMLGSINAESGQQALAREQLLKAISLDPSLPEAHFYLAHVLRGENRLEEAADSLEKAVAADDRYDQAWAMLGGLCGMLGRLERAEICCRRAVELMPDSAETRTNLANILLQQGKSEEAAEIYEHLLQAQPAQPLSWYMLGSARSAMGQLQQAETAFKQALDLSPGQAESLYGLGYVANAQHDYQGAADYFRQALQANPRFPQAENGLGAALQALGQYREALEHYDAALAMAPEYTEALFGRGSTLMVLGDTDSAISNLREAIQLNPSYTQAHITLASALMTHSKPDEAIASCEAALQVEPDNADAVALTATIEQHAGNAEQALARLQPWIDRGITNVNLAVAFAEVSKSLDQPTEAIALMEKLLNEDTPLAVTSQRNLHFNLGRLYDATGEYEKAFSHYSKGNACRAMDFNSNEHTSEIDAIIDTFGRDFLKSAPHASSHSDKPVFVVGMPRSGTSLVEQILASHPAMYGAGELPDMLKMVTGLPATAGSTETYPQVVHALDQTLVERLANTYLEHIDALAPEAARVIDKMPGNFRFLGLIEMLFPDARVVHCTRDPIDTCLSCYFQDFSRAHAYSYDLTSLGNFYNDYRRLMAHWQQVLSIPVLDVSYEKLIEDQEAVSRGMVEFCGLDWDDSCLNFHENRRFVATASYDQVRRPMYRKSVARWKHYEDHLEPLIKTLG